MKISMKYKPKYNVFVSSFLVMIIMTMLYYLLGYVPFGENSLAVNDANIQYVDFFAYLMDVFSGKNDIAYTFTKTLGGTCVGVYSYYLASPFNLLLAFFEKTSIYTFFHLVVLLKVSLAAATCSYFLMNRFSAFLDHKKYSNFFVIALSISYALGQYSIAQCSNIKWLEGVYILPLILLGVYEVVNKKSIWKLSLFVGLSIIFNWYTGGINCMFSIVWFVFEWFLYQIQIEKMEIKDRIKNAVRLTIHYGMAMVLGVAFSAILFLPTIGAMQKSPRGSLDFGLLLDFSFIGELPSAIQGYTMGAKSGYGFVSLYCGSIAIIGCIAYFLSKNVKLRQKMIVSVLAIFALLMYYWKPLFVAFSLFKNAESFWYRYSYCGIMVMIFISAIFFFTVDFRKDVQVIIKSALSFSAILLILNYLNHAQDVNNTNSTVLFVIAMLIAILFAVYSYDKQKWIRMFSVGCMILVLICEVSTSVKLQMNNYHVSDTLYYQNYVVEQEQQIAKLKEYDSGLYRVTQTTTRNMAPDNWTAYYNEGLAYGYNSISGYTSSPDGIQIAFLERLGYPIHGMTFCTVNTSILAADSLMGVKYVMSPYQINGLRLIEELGINNGKYIYENPFCLPMAFTYDKNDIQTNKESNPFVFQNELYSKLLGENVELYIPLAYENINGTAYTVTVPEGNYAVYGNLPWNSYANAKLNVNGYYETTYAYWLSPAVFYIPTNTGDTTATITVSALYYDAFEKNAEQFYALDLDKLAEVTKKLSLREASSIKLENGHVAIEIDASKGENLYLSIPYDTGWKVMLNGKEIETEMFGDCMYSIPLEEGKNIIEMTYSVKYATVGVVITIFAVAILAFVYYKEKKGKILCQTKSNV